MESKPVRPLRDLVETQAPSRGDAEVSRRCAAWGCLRRARRWRGLVTKHTNRRKSPRPPAAPLAAAEEALVAKNGSQEQQCLLFLFVTLEGNWSQSLPATWHLGSVGERLVFPSFGSHSMLLSSFVLNCLNPWLKNYFFLFIPLKILGRLQFCHLPRNLSQAAASHNVPKWVSHSTEHGFLQLSHHCSHCSGCGVRHRPPLCHTFLSTQQSLLVMCPCRRPPIISFHKGSKVTTWKQHKMIYLLKCDLSELELSGGICYKED